MINSHSVTTQHATYDEVLVAADGECRVDEMSSSYRPLVSKRVNRLFQLFQEPMTWTSIILLPVLLNLYTSLPRFGAYDSHLNHKIVCLWGGKGLVLHLVGIRRIFCILAQFL